MCAENEAGIGEASETTGKFVAKNPYDVPGQPDAPEVSDLTAESATLMWNPPTSDGGAEITNYVVEMKTGSSIKWTLVKKDIKDATFVVTGLKEETAYEFRVAAENKAGVGKASAPSKSVKYGKSDMITEWVCVINTKQNRVELASEPCGNLKDIYPKKITSVYSVCTIR